ncbi:MAG: cation:proton antiporter [Candidatus Latescibacteria bacterium]|nr:cation:proton antiporter [Candidatus Latescibacterota bacterium]
MKNFAICSLALLLAVLGPQRSQHGLFDTAWALGALMLVAFLAQRACASLRLPALAGWVAAGLLLGPALLKLVPPDPTLHLVHSFAALWVGFCAGLDFPRPDVGWRQATASALSTLGVFLAVAASLALLVEIPWELALIIGALTSLWGPFTIPAVIADPRMVSWSLVGNGCGLLLLSGALVLLQLQGLLTATALAFAGALWVSLLAGALVGGLLCWGRVCTTPRATLVGLGGSFLLCALMVDQFQLTALLFGFATGWAVSRRPDQRQQVEPRARAVQPLFAMLFFALAGAALDPRTLWPPVATLAQIALIQILALILLRGWALARLAPAGPRPRTWLLLPKAALLFELVYRPGGGLAELLAAEPARLLRQTALAELLAHAFVLAVLAFLLYRPWRGVPGSIVPG